MKVEISVDTSKFDRILSDLPDVMALARRKALKGIGAEIKSEAMQTFRHPQMRPSPWAPRKPSYIVKVNKRTGSKTRKLDDHPLLIKSGLMRQGIDAEIQGDDTVVIGTPQEYLKYHQFGTKHMPARPVLPLDSYGNLLPRALRKIMRIVKDTFSDEIKQAFNR